MTHRAYGSRMKSPKIMHALFSSPTSQAHVARSSPHRKHPIPMSFVQERITFASVWILNGTFSYLGLIMSPEESRWLFVTLIASFAVSGILSLGLKGSDESIRVILGRAGTSLLTGIFATYPIVDFFHIESAHKNVISLGGVAAGVSALGFILGFAGLEYLMRKRASFAKDIVDRYIPKTPLEKP